MERSSKKNKDPARVALRKYDLGVFDLTKIKEKAF